MPLAGARVWQVKLCDRSLARSVPEYLKKRAALYTNKAYLFAHSLASG